jgi:hypothetical protein
MEFWEPGRTALVRHCRHGLVQAVRPYVVVEDGPEGTLLWLARDTPVRNPRYGDGRPVREVPLAERFARPWYTAEDTWVGTDLLTVVRPGAWHTVNWFFEPPGEFRNWYVNVETPPVRWDDTAVSGAVGFDSDDLELDVVIDLERGCVLKDADELDAAVACGDLSQRVADRTRLEAAAAIDAATAGRAPFDGVLTDFRPAEWSRAEVPKGWDRPVASVDAEDLLGTRFGASAGDLAE